MLQNLRERCQMQRLLRRVMMHRFCLALGACLGLITQPAMAQDMRDDQVIGTLHVVLDGMVDMRQRIADCDTNEDKIDTGDSWDRMVLLVSSTLWANGYSAEVVAGAVAVLDGPALVPDCTLPRVAQEAANLRSVDWERWARRPMEALDFAIPARLPSPERWEQVSLIVTEAVPGWKAVFVCMSVLDATRSFPLSSLRWNDTIAETRNILAAAGYPTPDIDALLNPAMSLALLPGPAEDRTQIYRDCAEDDSLTASKAFFIGQTMRDAVLAAVAGE
jgi:hypothetical protein